MDYDLVAQCWLCSWPFREDRTSSSDVRTRRALRALLDGGYAGLVREIGHEEAARVVDRAAFPETPLDPKTRVSRPLRMAEQNEWVTIRNNTLGMRNFYIDDELDKAFWPVRLVEP